MPRCASHHSSAIASAAETKHIGSSGTVGLLGNLVSSDWARTDVYYYIEATAGPFGQCYNTLAREVVLPPSFSCSAPGSCSLVLAMGDDGVDAVGTAAAPAAPGCHHSLSL